MLFLSPIRAFSTAVLGVLSVFAPSAATATDTRSAFEFTLPGIDGDPLPLDQYRGQAVLLVNTASRCGYTNQYDGLQTLWERYKGKGLVVIGAPSNDFRQELKGADAVKEFCEFNFGINFPMSDIISVRGTKAHPLFAWAAANSRAPGWNFNKYLIDPNGDLVRHYSSGARPQSIARDIDAVLMR